MLRAILACVASLAGLVLVAPLVLLGGPIWLTALLTRRIAALLEPRSVDISETYVFDSDLGWRPRPNLDLHCLARADDVFHLVTGPDRWAGQGTVEDADVVVLGDSHAFGYGVDAERSFMRIHAEPRIKTIGAPGYNTVQELLALRQQSARLGGKLVVWLVYAGNDLFDNLVPSMGGYRAPFVRQTNDGWEIVTSHLKPDRWSVSKGRHGNGRHMPVLASLHGPTFLSQRAYDACAWVLGEGAEVCRAAGARMVVVTIPIPAALEPRQFAAVRTAAPDPKLVDAGYPDRQIGLVCTKLGVRFVPLGEVLTRAHFKRYDDHLTEAGHRVLADVIRRVHLEERVGVA
jgi:hypothetical protein